MASATDHDETKQKPTLERLINGPREEDLTLLEDKFGDEKPMKEPFIGVTKDTGLNYKQFESYCPNEPLCKRMTNVFTVEQIAALGKAGYFYHKKRKENDDGGTDKTETFQDSVLHFDGKFYKNGGRIHVERFTLNDKGETVEADKDGNPTTVRPIGIDDYFLPNLIDELLTESGAKNFKEFAAHTKTRWASNKARVLQVYWDIKNNKRVAVDAVRLEQLYDNLLSSKDAEIAALQKKVMHEDGGGGIETVMEGDEEQVNAASRDITLLRPVGDKNKGELVDEDDEEDSFQAELNVEELKKQLEQRAGEKKKIQAIVGILQTERDEAKAKCRDLELRLAAALGSGTAHDDNVDETSFYLGSDFEAGN